MRRIAPLIAPFMVMLLAGCATQTGLPPVHSDSDKESEAFSTYLSARFAAGEHDLPQAARYYGQALANDPGNPSLLALSFFYSTTSGDFDAAGKYAQAVTTATPDDRAARLALAVIGFKHKDYAEVRKQLSLSANLVHDGSGFAVTKAEGRFEDKIICDATITFRIMPFPNAQFRASMQQVAERLAFPMEAIGNG